MAKAHQNPDVRIIAFAALGMVLLAAFLLNLDRLFPDPPEAFAPPIAARVRVDVDTGKGTHPGASNILIEFTDYGCPFCQAAVPTINELEQQYGDKLNVVIVNFPVAELHPDAPQAAAAAECARREGKFRAYHDRLFENQDHLDRDSLIQYAKTVSLDEAIFTQCLTSGSMRSIVEQDVRAGLSAGGRGTPMFFANGYAIEGVQPVSTFT